MWKLLIGFPHFFPLQPKEDNFHILSNITKSIDNSIIKSSVSGSVCNLPFEFLKIENVVVPKEWTFSIENCEYLSIEKRIISQGECQEWFEQKKIQN